MHQSAVGTAVRGDTRKTSDEVPFAHLTAPWTVLHDVRRPGDRKPCADHVVVGPAGVFVVELPAWTGRVVVHDRVLRHEGKVRADVATRASEAAAAVAGLMASAPPGLVRPVLCFGGDRDLAGWSGAVPVRSAGNVEEWLSSQPAVLTPRVVESIVADLEARAEVRRGPRPRPVVLRPYAQRSARGHGRGRFGLRSFALGVVLLLALLATVLVPQVAAIGDRVHGYLVGEHTGAGVTQLPAGHEPAARHPRR